MLLKTVQCAGVMTPNPNTSRRASGRLALLTPSSVRDDECVIEPLKATLDESIF